MHIFFFFVPSATLQWNELHNYLLLFLLLMLLLLCFVCWCAHRRSHTHIYFCFSAMQSPFVLRQYCALMMMTNDQDSSGWQIHKMPLYARFTAYRTLLCLCVLVCARNDDDNDNESKVNSQQKQWTLNAGAVDFHSVAVSCCSCSASAWVTHTSQLRRRVLFFTNTHK